MKAFMRSTRYLVAALGIGGLFLLLMACASIPQQPVSTAVVPANRKSSGVSPTETDAITQQWVVFPEAVAEQTQLAKMVGLGPSFEGFWTPSADVVFQLEDKITDYLRQNPEQFFHQPPVWQRLDEYQRQYIGLSFQDGRQIIYGNFFCNNSGRDWRQQLIFVLDGGECYFQVMFDVDFGEFVELRVNGEA
ncbi:MAG: hypothetical protein U9R25_02050 [Chloroflexota bacterium]|nr:hypothetical protein [Chloroflexota bacterium]